MIKVNTHLQGESWEVNAKYFPRLFYTDFSGKTSMIKDIDIRYGENCIEIQTIITDTEIVKRHLENWIRQQKQDAKKQKEEANRKLEILIDCMPE